MGKENAGIRHLPEGYYHGWDLPCDRTPRRPVAGEFVLVKAEIRPDLAAMGAVVTCRRNGGEREEIPGRRVVDYHAGDQELMPAQGAGAEPLEYFLFELGRFDPGDRVEYQIGAGEGKRKETAGPFCFTVPGVYTAGPSASIHPREDGADVYFEQAGPYRPRLKLRFCEGRLHLEYGLAAGYAGALPEGATKGKYAFSDGQTGARVELAGEPFGLAVTDRNGRMLFASSSTDGFFSWHGTPSGDARAILLLLNSTAAHYWGFGERFDALDQNGRSPDVCVVNQYTHQGERTYMPVPFFLTERGYGMFAASDRHARFDLSPRLPGGLRLEAQVDPGDPRLELVFFFGRPREIVASFVALTGRPALPPKWVFGPWMSSNGWNTQREVEENLAVTEKLDIPATVLVIEAWSDEATFYIWNGAKYAAKPGGGHFRLGDFTFDPDGIWPDPKGLADKLHERGMSLVLWQIPALKGQTDNPQHQLDVDHAVEQGYCVLEAGGRPYRFPDGWFAGSLLPDFTNPAARDWWFAKRRYLLEDLGVDGFKTDGGEFVMDDGLRFYDGSDGAIMRNRYPKIYIQSYHEFMGGRAATFSRAGGTGSQVCPAYWAGDQASSFEEFRAVLRAGLSLGLSGNAFWGFDIGGFAGGAPTPDLYLRAAAMAVFCPIMQFHSDTPHGTNVDRTPWNIQACSGDGRVVPTYRFFAWLRMNLLPYIWRQARLAAASGEPLMRALCLDFPDDRTALELDDEYMFGRDLFVAPVLAENARARRVYLPEGEWLDFWTLQEVSPDWHDRYPCDLEIIPVFIRKGAVLPLNLGDSFDLGRPTGVKGTGYARRCFLLTGKLVEAWEYEDGDGNRVRLEPGEDAVSVMISGGLKEIYLLSPDEHREWEKAGEADWGGRRLNIYHHGR